MSENLERVRAFVAAWKRNDLEEVTSYFAEDCVYHYVPVAPLSGRKATEPCSRASPASAGAGSSCP